MNLWAVFQEGISRHRCVGVFDSLDTAVYSANKAAFEDCDSYHQYDVVPLVLNKEGEGEVVFSVSKTGYTLGQTKRHGKPTVNCATDPANVRPTSP